MIEDQSPLIKGLNPIFNTLNATLYTHKIVWFLYETTSKLLVTLNEGTEGVS